jgi:hypothetical protein
MVGGVTGVRMWMCVPWVITQQGVLEEKRGAYHKARRWYIKAQDMG